MTVELLYFDGCPSHAALLPQLEEMVGLEAPGVTITPRRIDDADAAVRHRFLGSPTVRIDGVDVEPAAAGRTDFGMKCRLYLVDGGYSPVPPAGWVRARLRGADHAGG